MAGAVVWAVTNSPLSPDPVSAYSWSFPVDAVDCYVEACTSVNVVADVGWVTAERNRD